MNSHKRSERLFIEAALDGLDGPTEAQVADAIHDAEESVYQDIQMALSQSKRPELADWLDKLMERNLVDTEDNQ